MANPRGAGRKKGTTNRKTPAMIRAERAAIQAGDTPLEFMLKYMRDESRSDEERFRAAQAAAPYVHPRLQSTTVSKKDPDKPVDAKDAQLLKLAKTG